jgi:hypothetical protein
VLIARESNLKLNLSLDSRRRWLVALCFSVFIGISTVTGYLLSFLPSFQEKCTAYCRTQGLEGKMVPVYPKTMTGSKEGRKECKCGAALKGPL